MRKTLKITPIIREKNPLIAMYARNTGTARMRRFILGPSGAGDVRR
jgi:hypothetical protein